LPNSLKVLLISDPTTDKAAASMDVYVGTNNDPEGFPGLAHFLEHMLFLGTDQFPDAGEYQQFISDQGGSHNAFTAPEHTNYFFSLNPKALKPALDRFSRFFIAPTLDPTYVDREVNAVHSEYQSKLRDPARLSFEATKQGLNPDHPFAQFGAGNLSTLNKPGLLDALKDLLSTTNILRIEWHSWCWVKNHWILLRLGCVIVLKTSPIVNSRHL
jgi:secreted Zn-dependent insulinase-like peptidase